MRQAMRMINNQLILLAGIPAVVSIVVIVLFMGTSRIRNIRLRRRRLESADRIELATTATAAIDAASVSLRKMIEVLPGTSAALTGRSAVTAIEATSQAILAILLDLPVRMQSAEAQIRRLDQGLKEMRELFNRLGK